MKTPNLNNIQSPNLKKKRKKAKIKTKTKMIMGIWQKTLN